MKLKRSIIAVVLCICILCNMSSAFAANTVLTDTQKEETITIKLLSGDRGIDYTKIKVDIYSAELGFSNAELGYYQYNESLSETLNFSSNGQVEFTKPSANWSYSIQLNSLPVLYGVDKHTQFFQGEENEIEINLERYATVELSEKNGELSPVLLGKHGVLYADTAIVDESIIDYVDNETGKNLLIDKEISVSVNGQIKNIPYSTEHNYSNSYEKYGYLYDIGVLSEKQYIESVAETYLYSNTSEDTIDSTYLYGLLNNYRSREKQVEECIDRAIQKLEKINDSRANLSVVSTSGRFRVWYDSTQTTKDAAELIADEYDKIYNLFVNTWDFLPPKCSVSTVYYYIYITDIGDDYGTTIPGENGESYIRISYRIANEINNPSVYSEYPNAPKGVLAHEYMHAMMFRYNIESGDTDRIWLHECLASWAGIAYESSYAYRRKDTVNKFLENPSSPLNYYETYGQRHYGSCIFALYIQQREGGYETIRRILELYSNSNNPLTAVDAALKEKGTSLENAFANFAAYNYDTSCYYNNITDGWKDATVEEQAYPEEASSPQDLQYLSSRYDKYKSGNTDITLTVTINFTSVPSGSVAKLKTICDNSTGGHSILSHTISSNRCTIVQTNFGSNYAKALTIVPINAGRSGTIKYTKSSTVSDQFIRATFDPQGGACSTEYKLVTKGSTYGTLPTPTRDGYIFVGWYKAASTEGLEIRSTSRVTMSQNHKLYAHWAKKYKITNVGANKCLNIYGNNVTSLSDGVNITLWSNSGTNEQKWLISGLGKDQQFIRSVIDKTYGLNVYRTGDPYNCNIHKIIGNEVDAQIDIIPSSVSGQYKLKLHNYDLYLTAASSADGSNVYWAAESTSNYQKWKFTVVS